MGPVADFQGDSGRSEAAQSFDLLKLCGSSSEKAADFKRTRSLRYLADVGGHLVVKSEARTRAEDLQRPRWRTGSPERRYRKVISPRFESNCLSFGFLDLACVAPLKSKA